MKRNRKTTNEIRIRVPGTVVKIYKIDLSLCLNTSSSSILSRSSSNSSSTSCLFFNNKCL